MPSQLGLVACPRLGTASTPKLISLCLENRACPVHALLRRLSFSVSTNQGHKASSSRPFISLPSIQKANRGQSSQMSPLIDWGEDE